MLNLLMKKTIVRLLLYCLYAKYIKTYYRKSTTWTRLVYKKEFSSNIGWIGHNPRLDSEKNYNTKGGKWQGIKFKCCKILLSREHHRVPINRKAFHSFVSQHNLSPTLVKHFQCTKLFFFFLFFLFPRN